MLRKTYGWAALIALAGFAGTLSARADELQPGSLKWPLWELKDSNFGMPRLGATNALGNLQTGYLHPGVDIRGANSDLVVAPETGDIWLTNADTDFCPHRSGANTQCRVYLLDPQKRYVYYFSHIDYAAVLGTQGDLVRAAIQNALSQQEAYDGTRPANELVATAPNTRIKRGELLGILADFPNYHHTHFGIYDLQSNFDMLDPLKYLEPRPATGYDFVDDERPAVRDLYLETEAATPGTGQRVALTGGCNVISGGKYDVIAQMDDTISSEPVQALGEYAMSNAMHRARLIIEKTRGARDERQWYDFDHLPLKCVGNWKAGACPALTWQTFFDVTKFSKAVLQDQAARSGSLGADAGAVLVGSLFASGSSWSLSSSSTYLHVLTNSWGENGRWDADAASDGIYSITAEGEDAAGNKAAKSLRVVVNKTGGALGANVVGDAMVRDRPDDTGVTPSNAGDQPFWISPDIIIRLWEDRDSVLNATNLDAVDPYEATVVAGVKYAFFIRVRNAGCASVSGISASLYAAEPAPVPGNWGQNALGTVSVNGSLGPASSDSQVLLAGPFEWTPTAAEVGHRCLLANINSAVDPLGPEVTDAPNDNNVAQRNLQVGGPFQFGLNNPNAARSNAGLKFDAKTLPVSSYAAELWIRNDPALEPWKNVAGTTARVQGDQLIIRFNRGLITLPEVSLPAATSIPAEFRASSPSDDVTYDIDFTQTMDGRARGGMTFRVHNGIITVPTVY